MEAIAAPTPIRLRDAEELRVLLLDILGGASMHAQDDMVLQHGAGPLVNVPFHELTRMNWLENSGNAHAPLFVHLSHLWTALPSPVARIPPSEWQRQADSGEATIAHLSAASGAKFPI